MSNASRGIGGGSLHAHWSDPEGPEVARNDALFGVPKALSALANYFHSVAAGAKNALVDRRLEI